MPRQSRKKSECGIFHVMFPDTGITSLEMAERRVVVRSLVEKGFAINQIARAMGLLYDQVYQTIRTRKK